ncbi:12950_t:CDS:2, partial [Acaulospora morrowiae]
MSLFAHIDISSIVVLFLIAYVSHYYYKYFTRESPLPGPIPLPLVGNVLTIARDISIWPSELQSKYGDFFEVYMGPNRKIWVCNEELAQVILKPVARGNFHNRIDKDCDINEIGLVNFGLALNTDYDNWAFIRKFYSKAIFTPAFMKQALVKTEDVFRKMESYWMRMGEDTVLDLSSWIKNFMLDATYLLTTGQSMDTITNYYNMLSPDKDTDIPSNVLKENAYVSKCSAEFLDAILWFMMVPKFVRDFPGVNSYTKRLKKQVGWLRNRLLKIVKTRREEIQRTPESEMLTPDLLTMFLTVNTPRDITEGIADDVNSRPMTDEEIAPNFMEISLSAVYSSTDVLCNLFHTISRRPEVKKRIIKELDEVFGKDSNAQITYEGLNKLVYCDALLNEVARVSSVSPFIVKKNEKPDQIGGYAFPEKTEFFINLIAIRKHKSKWTDPEVFNPDRFLDESHPDYGKDVYLFGSGLRKCPGRNLAKIQLKATIALFYKKYDLELIYKNAPLKYNRALIRECIDFK